MRIFSQKNVAEGTKWMRIEIGIGIPTAGGEGRGRAIVVRVLYRFQICSTYVYPFAYAFLPLFALHFNALSSLIRWRYAIHPHLHTPTHAHIHTHTHGATIQLKPQLQQHFFQQTRVFLEVFIEFTSPTCPTLAFTPSHWPLAGHNWPGQLVPRPGLVALCRDIRFQIPFLRSIFCFSFFLCYSPPSTITHICMPDVSAGEWAARGRGEGGCQVATCRATALSFDLGFAFFTRCGPLTDERIDGGEGEGEGGKRQAQHLGLGFHFCWCCDFIFAAFFWTVDVFATGFPALRCHNSPHTLSLAVSLSVSFSSACHSVAFSLCPVLG